VEASIERLTKQIFGMALRNGKTKVPVAASEFRRLLTFQMAYVGAAFDSDQQAITVSDGSRIFIQGGVTG
jgi:hypothetical protein